jgi:UDP-glucuronate decarboxylase
MTGSRSGLTFKPLPSDDPTQRRPDITLARQHLAWEPRVPLEIGLARTVEYFRDVLRRA